MKNTKKVLSLVLSILMLFACAVPASAAKTSAHVGSMSFDPGDVEWFVQFMQELFESARQEAGADSNPVKADYTVAKVAAEAALSGRKSGRDIDTRSYEEWLKRDELVSYVPVTRPSEAFAEELRKNPPVYPTELKNNYTFANLIADQFAAEHATDLTINVVDLQADSGTLDVACVLRNWSDQDISLKGVRYLQLVTEGRVFADGYPKAFPQTFTIPKDGGYTFVYFTFAPGTWRPYPEDIRIIQTNYTLDYA